MKKVISVLLLAVLLLVNITPAFAVNNQDLALEYSLKQSKSMCVVNSVAMMFRRQAIIDKNDNWKVIDESAIRNYKGNMDGIKIQNKVAYKNQTLGLNMTANATCLYSMKNNGMKRNTNPQEIIDKLKEYLNKHPEGIALYVYKNNTDFTHAVLLTHYIGDEFYCIDPANSVPKGIINLKDSILTDSVRANSKDLSVLFSYAVKIWYVSDTSNTSTEPKQNIDDNSSDTIKNDGKTDDSSNKQHSWWHMSYDSKGYCKNCGKEYDMDVKTISATTYQAVKNNVPVRNRPYSPEKITKWLSKGTKVTVVASGKNAAGNLWYKLSNGSWIYSKNLEKAKEVVPEASTLKINVTQYPTTITQGKSFGLRGTISSGNNVTSVKGYIINSSGSTVMSTTDSLNAKSINIRYLNLNEDMIFGNLSAGNYRLKIVAKDSSGGDSATWEKSFTVKPKTNTSSNNTNTSINTSSSSQTIADGVYVIATKLNTNYVLDIADASKDNGANLQLWKNNGTAAQTFKVTHIGNGYYQIINTNSGKALDAQNGDTAAGTNVWQYKVNNTYAQIWKIVDAGNGYYHIICKKSGLYLDLNNANVVYGENIKLWTNNGNDAQKWKFTKTSSSSSSASSSTSNSQSTTSSTSIRFELESVPKGNLKYGKSFQLKGWFRSDSAIVEARAYMLDSNKNIVMQSGKASSTTSNYKIQGYKLDKAMKFNELSPGGYYLKYYVKDANGDTATWISDKFYIVK